MQISAGYATCSGEGVADLGPQSGRAGEPISLNNFGFGFGFGLNNFWIKDNIVYHLLRRYCQISTELCHTYCTVNTYGLTIIIVLPPTLSGTPPLPQMAVIITKCLLFR